MLYKEYYLTRFNHQQKTLLRLEVSKHPSSCCLARCWSCADWQIIGPFRAQERRDLIRWIASMCKLPIEHSRYIIIYIYIYYIIYNIYNIYIYIYYI